MPNTPVREAAEGMPVYPRNPHRFAFVRKMLMFWHARAGQEPVVSNSVPESFMNQHVNRRSAFATTTALVAAIIPYERVEAAMPSEAPVEKVHRIAQELSFAMDDWMAALGGAPDQYVAEIYPSKAREFAIGFRHNVGGWLPDEKLFALEAAFHAEWTSLDAIAQEFNAAETRYMKVKAKRPVMRETPPEEIEAIRNMTIAQIGKMEPSTASLEHAEAVLLWNKADAAVRRKTGFDKIDRAYDKQTGITSSAADAVLRHPAKTIAGLAAKERVHRIWVFNGEDFNYILDDIARLTSNDAI